MIIYIYGSESFKKDIKDLLDHSNIKFRLDDKGEIKELNTLVQLKEAIENNPNNIYLIDDSKIIKKNSLNEKIKFLKPKDGIEQEYLLDHGIGDISVDSMEELSRHIIKRLESIIHDEESDNIQESIVEIVEDAYGKDEDEKDYFQLDEELSSLLSQRDEAKIEQIDEIPSIFEEEVSTENKVDEEDLDVLKDLSFDEDSANIKTINNEENEELNQGVNMADEFSEFDALNEADIMAALDGIDNDLVNQTLTKNTMPKEEKENKSLDLGSSNVDDIAKLISQLLNNKTLEITIKVKS